MEKTMATDQYTTSDIGLAAALRCLGYLITDMDTRDPSRVRFVFGSNPQVSPLDAADRLEHEVKGYYDKTLVVPAHTFYMELKSLKARVMSARPRR